MAAGCGLSVPITRITNTAQAAREFVAVAGGEIVCKLFANRVVEEGCPKVGHTHLLTAADLADLRGLGTTAHQLQRFVEKGIRALMARLGLVFGCLDFVVDQSGEHHYLEVNPTGQFGWLEGTVGVPITDALAELLARPLPEYREPA